MVFSTSMVMFAGEGTYSGDIPAVEYINFYDLNIVDVFCEDTGLNMEIIENPELLEQFLYSREIMRLQSYAIEAYNLLMREFICTANDGMQFIFRDDYAGAFIDDNHNLIIQLTNLDQSTVEIYNTLVEYSDVVSFTDVEFSLNELTEFGLSFVDMLDDANLQIASHGVDAVNNSYRIALYYADPESVAFKNNFNDMSRMLPIPISIELGSSMELSLTGGSRIVGPVTAFSVGATGTTFRGGHGALVTTGHFTGINVGTVVRANDIPIGVVLAYRRGIEHGGNPGTTHGDWAIISLNNFGAGMMTNRIRTGERLLPSWGIVAPIGTIVGGTGHINISRLGTIVYTGQTFGAANATGVTFVRPIGGVFDEGDSGGTVYRFNDPFSPRELTFEGVITGIRNIRLVETGEIIRQYWVYTPFHWFSHLFAPASPLNVPRISYPVRNWDQVNNTNLTLRWAPTSGVLYFVTLDRLQHGTWQHSHNIFRDRHAASNSLTIPRHYFDSGNNPYRITVIAWMGGEMLAYTRYFWLNVW